MVRSVRFLFPLLLATLLAPALFAQDDRIKWSTWQPIDERFNSIRLRMSYDDNSGRGWADGSHRWRIEVRNSLKKAKVRIALGYATWNWRTKMWEPPADTRPPSARFELEPGEVHEGVAIGAARSGFDYFYSITVLDENGQATNRTARGLANSRTETKLIAESSLMAQRAIAATMAPEEAIARGASPTPASEPSPPAPAPTAAVPKAPAPITAPAVIPMTAPSLPPANVEGLDASGKFALWTQRAQQGDADAMFELGRACRFGAGTAQDHVAATEWYRQAALRGHAGAMNKLAFAYNSGLGVERSDTTAVEWWQKAAAAGEPEAIKKLTSLGVAP